MVVPAITTKLKVYNHTFYYLLRYYCTPCYYSTRPPKSTTIVLFIRSSHYNSFFYSLVSLSLLEVFYIRTTPPMWLIMLPTMEFKTFVDGVGIHCLRVGRDESAAF